MDDLRVNNQLTIPAAELEERLGDAALLYEAAAQTSADPYLRSAALKLRAFAGECDRAMGRRTGLAGVLG